MLYLLLVVQYYGYLAADGLPMVTNALADGFNRIAAWSPPQHNMGATSAMCNHVLKSPREHTPTPTHF